MSIKILKHGKKPFPRNCTCNECQCEFTYELEDLKTENDICLTSYPAQYRRYVVCPECGKRIYVDTVRDSVSFPSITLTGADPLNKTLNKTKRDCETCPYKNGPVDMYGNPVAGDSMCAWCPNKSFYAGK